MTQTRHSGLCKQAAYRTRQCVWLLCRAIFSLVFLLMVIGQPVVMAVHDHSLQAPDGVVSNDSEPVALITLASASSSSTHKSSSTHNNLSHHNPPHHSPPHHSHSVTITEPGDCLDENCESATACDRDCTISHCCVSPVLSSITELRLAGLAPLDRVLYARPLLDVLSPDTDRHFRPPIV